MEAAPCSPQFRSSIRLSHRISPTPHITKPTVLSSKIPTTGDTFYLEKDLTNSSRDRWKDQSPLRVCEGDISPYPPSVIDIKIWNASQLVSSSYQTSDKEAPSNIFTSQWCNFSRTEMPTSGLLIHSSLGPLFPPPMSMSLLIIELKVPPGACLSNEMAAYPTLVCHSFNIHFELICHEANDWEDDKACKYTCGTVGTCDYQCVPEKKKQEAMSPCSNTCKGSFCTHSRSSLMSTHVLWERWWRYAFTLIRYVWCWSKMTEVFTPPPVISCASFHQPRAI